MEVVSALGLHDVPSEVVVDELWDDVIEQVNSRFVDFLFVDGPVLVGPDEASVGVRAKRSGVGLDKLWTEQTEKDGSFEGDERFIVSFLTFSEDTSRLWRHGARKVEEVELAITSAMALKISGRVEEGSVAFRSTKVGLDVEHFGGDTHDRVEFGVLVGDSVTAIVGAVDESVAIDGQHGDGDDSEAHVIDEGHEREIEL